jgi:hypothetical protein
MKKLLLIPVLLISIFCFAQDAKKIIGKPIKIDNLLVAQKDFSDEMEWDEANNACKALGSGWRLPTKTELRILYKNRYKIAVFSNTFYWSSSEIYTSNSSSYARDAWYMLMNNGAYMAGRKDGLNYARAVKTF